MKIPGYVISVGLGVVLAGFLGVRLLAQPATPTFRSGLPEVSGYGTMHLKAAIGSFKLRDGEGVAEISYQGSLLISQLKSIKGDGPGKISVSGDLDKQYDDKGRVLYYGKGTIRVEGKWRGLLWFGHDMTATVFGKSIAQLTGEFDKNGEVGTYWYNDPTDIHYWPAGMSWTVTVPEGVSGGNVKPKPRDGE